MLRFALLLFTTLFLSSQSEANSPNWSLQNTSSGWNSDALVKLYFHNSELQRQWAWELLGRWPLQGHEKILDFGCGDGKVTAEISRLTSGEVTGVDISSEMLRFAKIKFPRYAYPNLHFEQCGSLTFSDFSFDGEYDFIYSFCAFHLIANPLETLKNLKTHLKPQGKLLLVMPAGKNPAFFQAANEMFSKYGLEAPWNKKPSQATVKTVRTLEGCAFFLKEAGYEIITLEMIDTDNPFYNTQELISWMVGNTTANWNLPAEISEPFLTDLAHRMIELDPGIIDEEGRLHFKLSRIHVVATPALQTSG